MHGLLATIAGEARTAATASREVGVAGAAAAPLRWHCQMALSALELSGKLTTNSAKNVQVFGIQPRDWYLTKSCWALA